MFISVVCLLTAFVILIKGFSICGDSIPAGLSLLTLSVLIVILTISSEYLSNQRAVYNEDLRLEEEACKTPKLEASANGVELWSYRSSCSDMHPVYFSKSGTSQEVCHSSGKSTSCNTVTTPNSN